MDTNEMACHTWALSGNPAAGVVVHRAFESLMNEIGIPYINGDKATPAGGALAALRQSVMEQCTGLSERRTELLGNEVYLCGGFRNGAVCPEHLWLEELIDIAEREASSELFGILKRPDEKHVTERAYDNPKFVEDIVRDVAVRLNREERVLAYVVEAENFESIHNHSAYALIERDKGSG